MNTTYRFDRHLTLVALLALGAPLAACGSDAGGSDGAFLSIEGSHSVILPHSGVSRLAVRYHDGDDAPLAGRIDFEMVGNPGGTTLSQASADADDDGIVEIQIRAAAADVSFRVRASAPDAESVEWTVNVNTSGTLDVAGSYKVNSRFDVVTGMPGGVGSAVNVFVEMSDDPNDPATYVIDRLVDGLDNGFVEGLLGALRPGIDSLVNDMILDNAPDFVDSLLAIGDKLGQASRRLGIESTLVVVKNGATWKTGHKVAAYGFEIDGQMYSYEPAEIGAAPVDIKDIAVTLEADRMSLAEHTVPLRYGALLGVALEQVIIPEIDANASSLSDLMAGAIDCIAIGDELAYQIGFGSASMYEGACELGIGAASNAVMDQLAGIDAAAPINFVMSGKVRVQDTNSDLKADTLTGGKWTGNIDYAGTKVVLPTDSTFVGARM